MESPAAALLTAFLALDLVFVLAWFWWRLAQPAPTRRHGRSLPPAPAGERPPPPAPFPDVRLLFGAESTALPPQAAALLAPVLERLRAQPGVRVTIVGSADESGALARNRRLARGRAEAVAGYLAARGVARTRLDLVSLEPGRGATAAERERLRSATVLGQS